MPNINSYEQGWEARMNNHSDSSNPHEECQSREDWFMGWYDCDAYIFSQKDSL